VDAIWIDPSTAIARPVREVVAADLARLAQRSTDPDFGQACAMIGQLMDDGGQARWLTAQMAAGAGMNDLSRVASEMFERPVGEGRT
jgi:carboxylate-amine ligase